MQITSLWAGHQERINDIAVNIQNIKKRQTMCNRGSRTLQLDKVQQDATNLLETRIWHAPAKVLNGTSRFIKCTTFREELQFHGEGRRILSNQMLYVNRTFTSVDVSYAHTNRLSVSSVKMSLYSTKLNFTFQKKCQKAVSFPRVVSGNPIEITKIHSKNYISFSKNTVNCDNVFIFFGRDKMSQTLRFVTLALDMSTLC